MSSLWVFSFLSLYPFCVSTTKKYSEQRLIFPQWLKNKGSDIFFPFAKKSFWEKKSKQWNNPNKYNLYATELCFLKPIKNTSPSHSVTQGYMLLKYSCTAYCGKFISAIKDVGVQIVPCNYFNCKLIRWWSQSSQKARLHVCSAVWAQSYQVLFLSLW